MNNKSVFLIPLIVFAFGCTHTLPVKPAPHTPTAAITVPPHAAAPAIVTSAVKDQPSLEKPEEVAGTNTEPTEASAPRATDGSPSPADTSPALTCSPKGTDVNLDQAMELCNNSQELWQKGELDNALDTLDQAYALIIDVDTADNPELGRQKEDLRFMISKRILEIYASRNIVAGGTYAEIPIHMNDQVKRELKRFTGPERKFFEASLRRSGRYRPYITARLKEAGLPEELSWLPLIESGFKVKALSKARALGLWQFIPSTGYKFGLKRDLLVDERLNPQKSTHAAIGYLKELHGMFGDWATVLAAYNCGEGRVLRTIRSQNINYLDNFWDLYNRLPRETARYVPRFLATLHIIRNAETYGFDLSKVDAPRPFESITVAKQVHLKDVAPALGIGEKELKALNPELRYNILPGGNYTLNVPPGKGEALLSRLSTLKEYTPPQRAYVYHRVRRGDTLSKLAKRYRTSVRDIRRTNKLRRNNVIVAGNLLKIPQRGKMITAARKKIKKTYGHSGKHIVVKGDSLWNIARRYGTTTARILELNALSSSRLSIGQSLKLPGSGKSKSKSSTYRVRRGDSPSSIAKRHNMDLKRLLSLNRLTARSKIYPGQRLYLD